MRELQEVLADKEVCEKFQATVGFLFDNVCRNRESYRSYSKRMTEGQKLVILIWALSVEVANGGVSQFLFNSSGDDAVETIRCLEVIGAQRQADALKELGRQLFDGPIPENREKRMDAIVEFDRIENEENISDEEYDAAEKRNNDWWEHYNGHFGWCDDIRDLASEYIDSHPSEFTTDLRGQSWWRRFLFGPSGIAGKR